MLDVDKSYADKVSTVRGKGVLWGSRCNFKEDGQRRCWSQPLRYLGKELSKQGLRTYLLLIRLNSVMIASVWHRTSAKEGGREELVPAGMCETVRRVQRTPSGWVCRRARGSGNGG